MTGSDPGTEPAKLPFTYDQMKLWYDQVRTRRLQPALTTAIRLVSELMEENFSDFDLRRIKLRPGRIKEPARLCDKLNQSRYISKITSLNDIPDVIDDLIGLRIVCNNTTDISAVETMLASLPDPDEDKPPPIVLDPDPTKVRPYHIDPKPSGYRAYHVNLLVNVGSGVGEWTQVSVELQVRTLLQDGWGELTHEDTYKPGAELPPLIATLARRMANLLSCVDELAQDLRDELDRQATPRVVEEPVAPIGDTGLTTTPNPPELIPADLDTIFASITAEFSQPFPEEAIVDETRSIVQRLERPTPLATVAFQLQLLFGNHISRQHWGRFGSFKNLLLHAVPNVHIESIGPSWIIPAGFTREDVPHKQSEQQYDAADIPRIVQALRPHESNLPNVPREILSNYLESAAAALEEALWEDLQLPRNNVGIQHVTMLSKSVRDRFSGNGGSISRARFGYILLALLKTGNLRPGLHIDEIRTIFGAYLQARIGHHGIEFTENDRAELVEWLGH